MSVVLRRVAGAGLLLSGLLLAAMLAAGCSAGARASAGAADATSGPIAIHAHDSMRFDPPTIRARAGQPVQVTLVNQGQIVHDIVLTEGVAQPFRLEAAGKASASGSFTIEQPGTYTYICAQPGHEAAGMKGVIGE
jgi:plastocyanin